MKKTFDVDAFVWIYPGKAGWNFVTIQKKTSEEIDYYFSESKRGWGSLPVKVTVGKTTWTTSIFPDKKTKSYLLPIKLAVRKAEKLYEGDRIKINLEIDL